MNGSSPSTPGGGYRECEGNGMVQVPAGRRLELGDTGTSAEEMWKLITTLVQQKPDQDQLQNQEQAGVGNRLTVGYRIRSQNHSQEQAEVGNRLAAGYRIRRQSRNHKSKPRSVLQVEAGSAGRGDPREWSEDSRVFRNKVNQAE